MNRIQKILKKPRLSLLKVSSLQSKREQMKTLLSNSGIYRHEKNDLDFIHNEIMYQGLLNKKAFERAYEELRSELYDSWEHMEYEEKVNYINRKIDPIKQEMPSFVSNQTRITIPFFDELLNALYYNRMIIFERPQYFHLEKDFRDRLSDISLYGFDPYENGFISGQLLAKNKKEAVLYYDETRNLYHITLDSMEIYPLDPNALNVNSEMLKEMAEALLSKDDKKIMEAFIKSRYLPIHIERHMANVLKKEKN